MSDETAICRGCRRALDGEPYYKGGNARVPWTGELARKNHYGGFVCSENCDRRASQELEDSMPGHGRGGSLSSFAQRSLANNWRREP